VASRAHDSDSPHGLPRITVVTPSYNQVDYLEETIRSVLLQGYPDLEYVVIDGGSDDGSVELIRKYEGLLDGWVSEPDRGQTHALNKGFERSTGRIRAYLNSDDVFEPGALQSVAEAFSDGHDWVVGRVSCFFEGEGSFFPFPMLPGSSFTRWFLSCPVPQPGAFWSASLHQRVGPFREDLDYVMDYEFWLRMRFGLGVEPHRIAAPLARYRLHRNSKSVGSSGRFAAEIGAVLEPYETGLSPMKRVRLWGARRNRRALHRSRKAVDLMTGGQVCAGLVQVASALGTWPPVLVGTGPLLGLRRLLRGPSDEPVFPEMW